MDGTKESGDARMSVPADWDESPDSVADDATSPVSMVEFHQEIVHQQEQQQQQQQPDPHASARYLDELVKDMRTLDAIQISHPERLRHAHALITAEIDRVWSNIYKRTLRLEPTPSPPQQPQQVYHPVPVLQMNSGGGPAVITIQEKIMIPQQPDCKYIGRILGPRGISVKQLEAQTDCRILIRGKGSVKDPRREARLRNRIGWEHLSEPLHVLITASDLTYERCAQKLANAVRNIRQLLSSNDDEHKRRQLIQLAIINGTYRPSKAAT